MVAYAARHGEQEIPHGSVRHRMALHRPPSSRAHRPRTPQASRLTTGYPRRRHLLRPQERLPVATFATRVPSLEDRLDGLITNDKFCFIRRSRLKLKPKRRGYPSRKDINRGGNGETELDRSSHGGRPLRRRPSLGSGMPVPPPMGASEIRARPKKGGDDG